MTRDEMLAELLVVLNESANPVAYSSATLTNYLSEGQDKFCEDTGFFVDITNYTITLATGVAVYAIPTRAIQVMNIWDGTRRLGKVLQDSVEATGEWPMTTPTASGVPAQWQTDQTTGFIKLSPTPSAAEDGTALALHVWRYSRSPLDRVSSTITLTGTVHAGDVIAATVNGTAYSYAVLGSEETLSVVAEALADVIDAVDGLTASASGQVISISATPLEDSTTTTAVVSGVGAAVTATAVDVYSATSEIPARLQRACVEWASFKALSHHDMDTQDKVKAADHRENYRSYVRDGIAMFRRMHNQETRIGSNPCYRT